MTHDWMSSAPCATVDPELFFPEAGDYIKSRAARRICGTCPYKAPCVLMAIRNDVKFGIFGGLNPPGRKRLAQELNLKVEA